jgi:hypothetical protein
MAYEVSEITTATALQKTVPELEKLTRINQLVNFIKAGKTGRGIEFGDPNTKNQFLKKMDPTVPKNLSDMAVGISAAIAIRKYMKAPSGRLTVYMTGNVWSPEIRDFQVSAFGFADYNSADLVVTKDKKKFYGFSLKKKAFVKDSDPTLINKAFASTLEGSRFEKLRQKLEKTRRDYFASVVKEAVAKKIILKKDIKNFDKLDNQELYEAKNRDRDQFDRAYINTKGYATSPKGYLDSNTRDPKSMRYFVNNKLYDTKNNPLWKVYKKIINENSEELAEVLLNIILKVKLFDKLNTKKLKGKEFDFALVTGIGTVVKEKVIISPGRVDSLKTTLCGLTRIDKKYKGEFEVVQNPDTLNKSDAAKIFFLLRKGSLNMIDLRVRYKGDFVIKPQFQGYMTPEFKAEIAKECAGT